MIIDFKVELNESSVFLTEVRSMCLFNDEITEVKFLQHPYVVLSTNSEMLRVLNFETSQYELCLGHSDIIVAVDVFENFIVSGAKDNTL